MRGVWSPTPKVCPELFDPIRADPGSDMAVRADEKDGWADDPIDAMGLLVEIVEDLAIALGAAVGRDEETADIRAQGPERIQDR